ncbi:MAG TPA: hypothetical protein PLQ94_02410, partial [Anaerolineales bacterium]|nr:hypothetical protein [Anaerolineales bacterium]
SEFHLLLWVCNILAWREYNTLVKPLITGTFSTKCSSKCNIRKEKVKMKTSRLILILASLGSMFISFVPAIAQANRRLAAKQELAQRLDAFGKR